ncbi:MAG TPA: hypothetical protein VF040_19715 [Ktedonobacterales bacterium]
MKTPWFVTPSGEVLPIEPEDWLFEPGSWAEVGEALGTALPSDYKALIGDGRACIFDDELLITSPFDANPHANLVYHAARASWALAHLRAHNPDPEFGAVLAYPEQGGLLSWGVDGGGGTYHWDTLHPDPDQWTIYIEGRPLDPDVERHALSLTGYLDALRRGEVKGAALSHWPGPNPVIRRVDG